MKRIALIVASLAVPMVFTLLMTLAGCGEDHGYRVRGERDRSPEWRERSDSDRHEEHHDADRHD